MKALSLWQPWASLIFGKIKPDLFKQWETRSWYTTHRGPLLIHAGATHFSEIQARNLFHSIGIEDYFHNWWYMPYGAILGQVEVVSCLPTEDSIFNLLPEAQRKLGDFSSRRFAWGLERPILFETPIPFSGRQRLFNVPDILIEGRSLQSEE